MRWWELVRQAVAGVARARLRSTLTALGVAIGCGALVSMMAFALGLQRQIEAPFLKLGLLNEIHVSPRDRTGADADADGDAMGQAPSTPAALDAAALEQFRAIPGVRYAYPDMSLHDVQAARGDKATAAFAMALPREVGAVDQFAQLLIAGTFFSLDDAPEAVIGEGLLEEFDFKNAADAVGKTIDLSAAGLTTANEQGQFQFEQRTISVEIVGVFQPPGVGALGPRMRRALLLPVDVIEQLPGLVESQLGRMRRQGTTALDSYENVTVRAENPAAVPRIAAAIRDQGYSARTMLSRLEDMRIAFLFVESLLTAVGSVALVVAALGIANTLLMTVMERYEEIGLYKAIGATDGDVRLLFMAEAAVLGLVGSLTGLALAAVMCWGLQWGVNLFLAREGIERTVDVFYFPWWLLVGAVAVATALSVASGLYPASRAARVDPIKALRRS